jgi:hypothetical protein
MAKYSASNMHLDLETRNNLLADKYRKILILPIKVTKHHNMYYEKKNYAM